MASTFDTVRRVIVEQTGVDACDVYEDAEFAGDRLACDSLDTIEITMALEEEFDIEIPDEDTQSLRTVGEAVAYIDRRLAANEVD